MTPATDATENEDLARLALRAAVDIDRYQRGKINSLASVEKLRSELVRSSGFDRDNGTASFSGDLSTVSLIGAAIYNLPDASVQKIDELAGIFAGMMDAISKPHVKMNEDILNKIRDFCLFLNQEAVKSRYIYDADDSETSNDGRRIN